MSKTAIEVVDIVYQHLLTSALFTSTAKPNGELRRYQRASGSQLEDVVVNSLALNREFVQRGVLNVNVFVPNLSGQANGVADNSQPNITRLRQLGILTEQALSDIWAPDGKYNFSVQQDNLMQDENNQHYLNFRIEFINLNIPEH